MISKTGGAHQVEFRWRENHDFDVYAHSGVNRQDLDKLREVVLPVGRAPRTGGGPSMSVVHLVFPNGLGSTAGQPVGVVAIRSCSTGAGTAADTPGGSQSRLGLATRVVIVPGVDVALSVALGLASQRTVSSRSGEGKSPKPGVSLRPLPESRIRRLCEAVDRRPLDLLTSEGWKVFDAAVGMLLERPKDHARRLAITIGPDWTVERPSGENDGQLALVTCFFHALRGPFCDLPELEKPWDGSFSTFESLDTTRGGNKLPQIIFRQPSTVGVGVGMASSYGCLSPQVVNRYQPKDPSLRTAVHLLRASVDTHRRLWQVHTQFPHDETVTTRLRHLTGEQPLPVEDRPAGRYAPTPGAKPPATTPRPLVPATNPPLDVPGAPVPVSSPSTRHSSGAVAAEPPEPRRPFPLFPDGASPTLARLMSVLILVQLAVQVYLWAK